MLVRMRIPRRRRLGEAFGGGTLASLPLGIPVYAAVNSSCPSGEPRPRESDENPCFLCLPDEVGFVSLRASLKIRPNHLRHQTYLL